MRDCNFGMFRGQRSTLGNGLIMANPIVGSNETMRCFWCGLWLDEGREVLPVVFWFQERSLVLALETMFVCVYQISVLFGFVEGDFFFLPC